jgi:hypothetical protein
VEEARSGKDLAWNRPTLKGKTAKGLRGAPFGTPQEEEGGNLVKNKAYAIKTIEIVKNFPHKLRKGL